MLKHICYYLVGFAMISFFLCCGNPNGTNNGPAKTNGDLTKEGKTPHKGYSYTHHIQNEGPKPQVGEYAYYEAEANGYVESRPQPIFIGRGDRYVKILSPEQLKTMGNPATEALPLMAIGDSITLKQTTDQLQTLPPELNGISYILYQIKLTDIKTPEEHSKAQIAAFNKKKELVIEAQSRLNKISEKCQNTLKDYKSDKLNNEIIETGSGLKYIIHEKGKGKPIKKGTAVDLLNYGTLMDGTVYENSFETGSLNYIHVGNADVLPALDEGLSLMNHGTKATLFVPYHLAYGEEGVPPNIPGKADVMIYIELLHVN